jgi:hypothetical protein
LPVVAREDLAIMTATAVRKIKSELNRKRRSRSIKQIRDTPTPTPRPPTPNPITAKKKQRGKYDFFEAFRRIKPEILTDASSLRLASVQI